MERPRRKNPRMPGHDYTVPGGYLLTICLRERTDRLGHVRPDGSVEMSPAGIMVRDAWLGSAGRFADIGIDDWIVMPDHLHGILFVGIDPNLPSVTSPSVVVQWFKTVTTKRYGVGVRDQGWPSFDRHLWQRSFYDGLLRDDRAVDRARAYVRDNPARWLRRRSSA